ncbi:MAG TPA: FKBP-type peptidyl-prolyl cis-trans isomerase [Solirubrobacterales bacterium]|nr:FKBP-type peptidyl-prolyl cis-trans isomerase [Solirubrobacterales bacterium]
MGRWLPTLVAGVALALAGCGGDDSGAADSGDSIAPKRAEPTVEIPDERPPTRLLVSDIEEGDGEEVGDGDTIRVDYVGVYYESGREFENSWANDAFETFTMGSRRLIDGWDQGLEGMKVGGRRELVIPSDLAFGNGAVVYVVDLRGIE